MIFKKLQIQNIRSYEDAEMEFPMGATLLSGDIGAGKTSVLLALQFALFGLQPGQKGASILKQGKDTAYVKLEIEVNEKQIILERTLKKTKTSITQDKNIITINGTKEELSTSEMKNKVIDLLNYPKEFAKKSNLLYKFTVYTPQEEMKEIVQERPEIRLDTLRHIFGIDRYKRIKENSQTLNQKLREAIKLKQGEISELNNLREKLTNYSENKIKLAREINNLSLEKQQAEKEKQQVEENLNSLQELIKQKNNLQSELEKAQISQQGKTDLKNRLEKEINSMQIQIKQKIDFSQEKLEHILKLLEKHNNNLEQLNSKFMALNSRISVLNSKKDESIKMKNSVAALENCPTCFQSVSQEHKEKISKRTQYDIEEVDRELENKLQQKAQTQKDIQEEKKLIFGYEEDKNKLQQDKIKSEHQKTIETKIKSDSFVLDRTTEEIKNLIVKQEELKTKLTEFQETDKIHEQYKQDFQNINQKLREKEIQFAERNKELELLKTQIENLQEDIQKKENTKKQLFHLKELQDWLQEKFLSMISLTEKNVLAKLRNEFSKIFSEWFSMLVSDTLSVKLDENFTPVIINQDYEIDYDFLSGGERTAVALAYRLALNQVLNSLLSKINTKDIVILDEPTDGFSEEQIYKMRDIFEQLNSQQTILVSHEQKIEGFVDHIIKISKDGTSNIEKVLDQ